MKFIGNFAVASLKGINRAKNSVGSHFEV